MHFDPTKPHGVVSNHSQIRYEQNGRSYDRQFRLIGGVPDAEEEIDTVVAPKPLEPGERDFELEQARAFLLTVLAEGPIRRAELYKVAETNNQSWDKVKTAFAAMEGQITKRNNSVFWQLKAA
jgi:hypothetical protein